MVVRKHWLMVAGPGIFFLLLILIPPVFLALTPFVIPSSSMEKVEPLINFGLALYFMVLTVFLFLFWTLYYLDMWIITSNRIIDIEQHGLFSREISEIPMIRVQDVTIEIHGLLETLLKFGTIRVQTAGEREFFIKGVPKLYEIKNTILKYAHPESITKVSI